jgi:hypothetical protein
LSTNFRPGKNANHDTKLASKGSSQSLPRNVAVSAGRVGGVSTPGATCGRCSRELSPVGPVGRPGELTHGFVQIRAADGELPLL